MEVIGTVGLAGSGKGEFAAVAEELGVPVVTMGDTIREACRERGLDPAEHHGRMASRLREQEGPAAIAERTLPAAEAALEGAEVIVIDGIRSDVEVEVFRQRFGDAFTLVSIEAPRKLRKQRVAARGREGDDGESVTERDERERGFGLDAAMERADVTIENTGTLESFRERTRELLEGE